MYASKAAKLVDLAEVISMNFYISFVTHIKATRRAQSFVYFCARTETYVHMKERALGLALKERLKVIGECVCEAKSKLWQSFKT